MSRTVLFAGGPLHGTVMTVADHTPTVCAVEPPEISIANVADPFGPPFRQVAYRIGRFAICGRVVWVGYLSAEPDDDLVFEVLTSDNAKAASSLR